MLSPVELKQLQTTVSCLTFMPSATWLFLPAFWEARIFFSYLQFGQLFFLPLKEGIALVELETWVSMRISILEGWSIVISPALFHEGGKQNIVDCIINRIFFFSSLPLQVEHETKVKLWKGSRKILRIGLWQRAYVACPAGHLFWINCGKNNSKGI